MGWSAEVGGEGRCGWEGDPRWVGNDFAEYPDSGVFAGFPGRLIFQKTISLRVIFHFLVPNFSTTSYCKNLILK
jgi:hypothetical protein